jgi:hypothetical protein
MSDSALDVHSQALAHLQKANSYRGIGLNSQAQHELWQAQQLDPAIVGDPQFQTLYGGAVTQSEHDQSRRFAARIGAVMLFINALINGLLALVFFTLGNAGDIGGGALIALIVNVIIGVNLWRGKAQWQRNTLAWAVIGLLFWGIRALVAQEWPDFAMQVAFSLALFLLLTGTPARWRNVTAVVVYAVGYLGVLGVVILLALLHGLR